MKIIRFVGTYIIVGGGLQPIGNTANLPLVVQFSIDNGQSSQYSPNSPDVFTDSVYYQSGSLPMGEHVLTVTNLVNGDIAFLDYFEILASGGTPQILKSDGSPIPQPQSTSASSLLTFSSVIGPSDPLTLSPNSLTPTTSGLQDSNSIITNAGTESTTQGSLSKRPVPNINIIIPAICGMVAVIALAGLVVALKYKRRRWRATSSTSLRLSEGVASVVTLEPFLPLAITQQFGLPRSTKETLNHDRRIEPHNPQTQSSNGPSSADLMLSQIQTGDNRVVEIGFNTIQVDNVHPFIFSSGNWNEEQLRLHNLFNDTVSLTFTMGSKKVVRFFGTSISVFGALETYDGVMNVAPNVQFSLDGGTSTTFTAPSPQIEDSQMELTQYYQSPNLTVGEHVLTIRNMQWWDWTTTSPAADTVIRWSAYAWESKPTTSFSISRSADESSSIPPIFNTIRYIANVNNGDTVNVDKPNIDDTPNLVYFQWATYPECTLDIIQLGVDEYPRAIHGSAHIHGANQRDEQRLSIRDSW
ncbi:hypothetical protein CVT24_000251 [Panaeolus cyanescens]|uniref:Uncharacterized protein n=1 Tax=Panaeolus cyanescens TaxID=181874 RepID=A0A409YD68_9AGAR|nr:hypothetical protein CVT24_000251 [Panaeolus cyanescens]